jgi:tripartite-type tricarboxylate transporter receptor subunit TctC
MRILADQLTGRLKQQFVVKNRPGAGGILAAKAAASAAPNPIIRIARCSSSFPLLRCLTDIRTLDQFNWRALRSRRSGGGIAYSDL